MGFRIIQRFWLLCCLLILLVANSAVVAAEGRKAADPPEAQPLVAGKAAALPQYSNEELLTRMLLVDASERTLDGRPALAITFSQNLKPTENYNSFITLTSGGKKVEGSWILATEPRRLYFTNIQPQTAYRVQIRPGVTANNGLKLQQPADAALLTRDIKPAFDFASRGSILPANLTSGLPIRVVNVPELDIEFLRVRPEKLPQVLDTISLGGQLAQWQLEEIHQVTESIFSSRYQTGAEANTRTSMVIPVESIDGLREPGLYFAVMRQPGRFSDDAYRITQFVVTNIGLHVRLYPRGLEVFVNALDTGKPMPDVTLKLRGDKESRELKTDDEGHAGFVYRPAGDLLLMASLDSQFAFLDLREAALDLSEYPVTGMADKPIDPFVYASRDLYRPGETVDLSILLRDRDGGPVPNKNLELRLIRPDTRPLLKKNLLVADPELGFFSTGLSIPADAPTGTWKVEVRINAEDETPAATFPFQVEEFLPERMKLTLTSEDSLLTEGEKLIVSVQGDYLYGAPAVGNRVTSVRTIEVDRHPLDALKSFYFGDPADSKLAERQELPELLLDESGAGFVEIPALSGKIHSPLTLKLISSLHETGGRSVTRTLDTPFWPKQHLVGIRPLFDKDTAEGAGEAAFELVRVNVQGQPAPLEQPLAVTLVREEKEFFWEYNDAEGWQRKEISSEYPVLQQKVSLNERASADAVFSVQYGYYRLEVEDPETGLRAVYPFHAGWDWEMGENTSARPDQIELSLDKPAYAAGDIAKVTITPPSAGEAIVGVEGESMLWSKRIELPKEGATVEIPIDDEWNRHDMYVTVTSFRPASKQERIAPNRALGIAYLPLERSERRLGLSIEAPAKVLPEQPVSVTVAADNLREGEKAMLTLAAVDVGVLDITGFETPDPFAHYFSQHEYGVNLHDAYGRIIENIGGKPLQQRFGGDADGSRQGGSRSRADVRIVSLFSGVVQFEGGKANVELPLPGFDGTLRLMAVAASANRFGSAEQDMQVASPVVASLAGPRFLAPGDKTSLYVELNNTTEETQTVQVEVNASQELEFIPLKREVILPVGKRETLVLPLNAKTSFGTGSVNLQVDGKGFTARRQLQFAIRPAWPAKHFSEHRELKPGESLALNASSIQGFLPDSMTASLSLAATPPLPLHSALNGLLQYPYGCVEQTVSSAWPYLFLEPEVAEKLGLKPLTLPERNERVNAALLRLAGMQLANGSFTLWGGYGQEEYWLTPYVTDFLLDARKQGFEVPEWMLQRALDNLGGHLQEGVRYVESRYGFSDAPGHLDVAARAYAAYVLSRENPANLGTVRNLYDRDAAQVRSGLPLVHIGLALEALGDNKQKRSKEAFTRALEIARDKDSYLGDYGSPLRDQAAMLSLLLRNKTEVPELAKEINELVDLIHNRTYLSTQEQLFVFLAGLEIGRKADSPWKADLKIGDNSEALGNNGMLFRALNASAFQQGGNLTAAGDKPVYTSLVVDGYPDAVPEPVTEPVEIRRDWYNMKGEKLQVQDIKAGDLLLTHLMVNSAVDINDALVADLLPAGFEIENTNLYANESLQALSIKVDGVDRLVTELLGSSNLRTQEFRDDRYLAALPLRAKARHHLFYLVRVVSKGEFSVPPPYVEDMYRPSLFGVGTTPGVVSIRD